MKRGDVFFAQCKEFECIGICLEEGKAVYIKQDGTLVDVGPVPQMDWVTRFLIPEAVLQDVFNMIAPKQRITLAVPASHGLDIPA